MTLRRLSFPFSVTIMALMAVILMPLAGALLWLGWRSVAALEQRSADQRVSVLEEAVERFLSEGLRNVVSVGETLADDNSFQFGEGLQYDEERRRSLAAVLARHAAVSAAFVGYEDGRFFYAGRTDAFWVSRRAHGEPVDDRTVVMRSIAGDGADRLETWWFMQADGQRGAVQTEKSDYDPRQRPWYVEAMKAKAAILTAPYRFSQSNDSGISAGVPLSGGGGVVGFDFTLSTLSELLTAYKVTPSSAIMVGHGGGGIEIESEPCASDLPDCLGNEADVRAALRAAIAEALDEKRKVDRRVMIGKQAYRIIAHRMQRELSERFVVAAAVPSSELAAASRILLERAALAAAFTILMAGLAALVSSLLVSRSVGRITAKTERIRQLDFSDHKPVRSRISEVARLSEAIERMREGLEIFGRYVSRDLVHQVMRAPETTGIGGTRRDVTVMFTDIESFSLICETMEPELLTSRLSRYFDAIGSAISANRGMIDKYIGDSIMAFWNAPQPDPDHVVHACRAALEARDASNRLQRKWHSLGRPGFRTRFGLHTGTAVVGNVGARERINYTLVGAVANQASRLEGLNKVYGTEILASGEVARATSGQFVWRHVDRVVAVGTTEEHDVFEPLGEIEGAEAHLPFIAEWEAGRQDYVAGRFEEALGHFRATAVMRPDDGPSRVFAERCAELLGRGAPADWDGTWRFVTK